MSWKVRHEGSPQHVEGLTAQQAAQGLADGQWEPTDEVMGPNDRGWIAFENHPLFAEIAMDVEPREAPPYDDEARLDMNALIDVCLVLLIFFILTTTYASLQKIMRAPSVSPQQEVQPVRIVKDSQDDKQLVHVSVDFQGGRSIVKVENDEVPFDPNDLAATRENLMKVMRKYEGGSSKLTMLLEHHDDVPHGTLIQIQDAAKSIKIEEVLLAPKAAK